MEIVADGVKAKVIESISKMSEDCSYDDIFYNVYILQKFESGIKDFESELTFSHNQVEKELEKWLV